jgi:hypothetical protein
MVHTIENRFILDFIKMDSTIDLDLDLDLDPEEEKKKFAFMFRSIHYLLKENNFESSIDEVGKKKVFLSQVEKSDGKIS